MFVISVPARRGCGHVVACDLLRVVARAKNRLFVRGRVAAAFSGYLVSENEAGVWRGGSL